MHGSWDRYISGEIKAYVDCYTIIGGTACDIIK